MKLYKFYAAGTEIAKEECEFSLAKELAKSFCVKYKGHAVFICVERMHGTHPIIGYYLENNRTKMISKDKDETIKLFSATIKKKSLGGAPRKHEGGGAKVISFAVSIEEQALFETYTQKFAGGNKSEMFRRMFKAWKGMMEQVVGQQIAS